MFVSYVLSPCILSLLVLYVKIFLLRTCEERNCAFSRFWYDKVRIKSCIGMLNSPIEEIKNRLDMVQVVGEYVKLQKAGANYRALCPFHSEKGPSFFVSPARQMYHCFGCSAGGDVFQFIQEIEGVEFGDALRLLAAKAGVELKQQDPSYARMQSERKRLLELMEWATLFFEKQFRSSKAGEEVTAYLQKRGVKEESLKKWRVGYAPESSRALLDFLLQKGFLEQEIGRAGLLVRSDNKVFDRFRSRIMFPVFDLHSQVIGFGGRIFGKEGEDLAKYINTPASLLYDKGRILYGLDKAKLAVRKQDTCILVEGYTDVILVSQAGSENVVATSGTALTGLHVQLLKRYSENLLLAFDMDIAGDSATKRGIDLAVEQGLNIKIVRLPQGKDPADLAAESPAAWEKAVKEASSIFDYSFESTFAKVDKNTAEGKKAAANILLPVIKKIPNAIEQTHWIQRLTEELGMKEETIREELQKVREEPVFLAKGREVQEKEGSLPKTRRELLEERILALLFKSPENVTKLQEKSLQHLSIPTQEILSGIQKQETVEITDLQKVFPTKTLEYLQYIALQAEFLDSTEDQEQDNEEEFQVCLLALDLLSLKERLDAIAQEIKKAEAQKDTQKLQQLLQEFDAVSKDLANAQ